MPSLRKAYSDAGCTVEVGREMFFERASDFDLVHCHWPE